MRVSTDLRYVPDRGVCRIDLSDNTNAWGMSPAARRAIAGAELSSRYPSPYGEELKEAIAGYLGVTSDMIATGCGSDDVLDATIRAVGKPGDRLAYPTPTFVMIPTFATLNGLVPTPTPLDGLPACAASVVYLCSPNNPTGSLVSRERIEAVCHPERSEGSALEAKYRSLATLGMTIIDEAYAEFSGTSVVDIVARHDRLIVTRTMSKAFGLAGLRVGYAIARPAIIAAIEASRGPYKVSAIAERAAVAALTDGLEWMSEHAALAVAVRERLSAELRDRGFEPLASAANFVFVPMPNAIAVGAAMLDRGIRVRAFGDPAGLRITVASWPIMRELLATLDEVRRCA